MLNPDMAGIAKGWSEKIVKVKRIQRVQASQAAGAEPPKPTLQRKIVRRSKFVDGQ
jgi:hypothetical protein